MFGLFRYKKRINNLKNDVKDSFNQVKEDFNKVGKWISHLDEKHKDHFDEIEKIKKQILDLQSDLMEIKNFISFFDGGFSRGLSKQAQTSVNKQTATTPVQTLVQTAVQTDILDNLTVMERAIVWSLLNSEMSLSYEDLAALLGKNKSTIRGQINTIKQKTDGLIVESREINGKKRLVVPENIKESIIKNIKIRTKVNKNKKSES